MINRPIVYSSLFSLTGCVSVLSSVYLRTCPPGCALARVYSKHALATVFLRGLSTPPTPLKLTHIHSILPFLSPSGWLIVLKSQGAGVEVSNAPLGTMHRLQPMTLRVLCRPGAE